MSNFLHFDAPTFGRDWFVSVPAFKRRDGLLHRPLLKCEHGHMTHNTYCGMNILSRFQLPDSSGLGLTVFGRYLD